MKTALRNPLMDFVNEFKVLQLTFQVV